MIPKIVHYVWFGGKPYPKKIKKCIESWEKYLKGYQFIRWDESNFDVNSVLFTRQAFEKKQWAFIADYVRVAALYEYGGWYLDTDVEVLKPLSQFEHKRVVFGTDEGGSLTAVYGTEPHNEIWSKLVEKYKSTSFILSDGLLNQEVVNKYIQDVIAPLGYIISNQYQDLGDGIVIYPDDYFHVVSLETGKRHYTENSTCIHWQTMTWTPKRSRFMRWIRLYVLKPILGEDRFMNVYFKIIEFIKIR